MKEDTELGFQKGGYIRLNQINIPASPSVHKLQNDLILSTQTLGSLKYTLQGKIAFQHIFNASPDKYTECTEKKQGMCVCVIEASTVLWLSI